MSLQLMIASIEELSSFHEDLINISVEKSEAVIKNDIAALQQALIRERKTVQKLEQSEHKRASITNAYVQKRGLKEASITAILEDLDTETEQQALETAAIKLTKLLTELRQKEQTSRSLVEQSLQFVQYSLNLLSPSINTMNYSATNEKKGRDRSVFDSKA